MRDDGDTTLVEAWLVLALPQVRNGVPPEGEIARSSSSSPPPPSLPVTTSCPEPIQSAHRHGGIEPFGPTEYNVITQHFGVNPQYYAQFGLPGHEGIDFRAPHGTMIFACADGTVYRVETADNNNYGIHVRIEHADGYKTVYAHLMKPLVMVGDIVRAGEVIGLADNTGNSHGDHLHLTLKLGERILDPTPFLLPFGLDKTGQFGRFLAATGRPRASRAARGYCGCIPSQQAFDRKPCRTWLQHDRKLTAVSRRLHAWPKHMRPVLPFHDTT